MHKMNRLFIDFLKLRINNVENKQINSLTADHYKYIIIRIMTYESLHNNQI